MWGERLDDLCSCGCRGIKVLPLKPEARVLPVKRVCGCGNEKTYDPAQGDRHAMLCWRCTRRRQRSARWTFACAGYVDYGVRHSRTCSRTRTYTAPYVHWIIARGGKGLSAGKRWGKSEEVVSGPPGFSLKAGANPDSYGPEDVDWRCRSCITAAIGNRGQERVALRPIAMLERIQSRRQRRELQAQDKGERLKAMQPTAMEASRAKRQEEGISDEGRKGYSRGKIVAWWSRPTLPLVIVYQCVGCAKLNFVRASVARRPAYKSQRHQRCLWQWQRSEQGRAYNKSRARGLPAAMPGDGRRSRGRPATQNRVREFAWAIRHYLGGQSFRDIAADFDRSGSTIKDGVDLIISRLPAPEYVSKEFRRHVELLQAAAVSEFSEQLQPI
jgi:hypothetical protein